MQIINDMPIPENPYSFFGNTSTIKIVNITNSVSTWRNDLILAEKFFSEMIVCPFIDNQLSQSDHTIALDETRDILKQRMKYPNIKDFPEKEKIAKTWILPNKLISGPNATTFLHDSESSVRDALPELVEEGFDFLKVELPNGKERKILYAFLDNGFKPSLILVKWSNDLDNHIPTAQCAGHLTNCGYSLVALENGYALYMSIPDTLYDLCSMKEVGSRNIILDTILNSVSQQLHGVDKPNPGMLYSFNKDTNESTITTVTKESA